MTFYQTTAEAAYQCCDRILDAVGLQADDYADARGVGLPDDLAEEETLRQAINTWLIAHDELPEGVNL